MLTIVSKEGTVIYFVEEDIVYILCIIHRREAYKDISVEDLFRRLIDT